MNGLVSPYYEEAGGTVIDWAPPSWAGGDDEDEDEWGDEDQDTWLPDDREDQSAWLAHDDDHWA